MSKATRRKIIRKSGFERTIRGLRSDISQLVAAGHHAARLNRGQPQTPDMVFIWIPKTAGTSVYEVLRHHYGMKKLKTIDTCFSFPQRGAVTFGHMSYNDLLATGVVHEGFSKRAYKFSFVRCPYARAVSLFNYLKQTGALDADLCFHAFLDDVHRARPAVGMYNVAGLSQTNPQVDWLIGADGAFVTDEIFKLEDMGEFCRALEARFGIAPEVDRKNVSEKQVLMDEIAEDREVLEKIEEIYKRDFDILGYDRISSP